MTLPKIYKSSVTNTIVNLLTSIILGYVFFIPTTYATAQVNSKDQYNQKRFQSLTYIVQKTLRQNPNILESLARERQASANLHAAQGGLLPQLTAQTVTGSGSYTDDYRPTTVKTTNETEVSLNLIQPIFSGWSSKNTIKERRFELKAAGFSTCYTKELLTLQAINTYLEILRLQKLQQLAIDNTKVHADILKKVTTLYQGGAGKKSDVELADGRLAESKNTLELITKDLQNVKTIFSKIVGEPPQQLQDPILPTLSPTILNIEKSQHLAYHNHPALLANQEGVAAAKMQIAIAKSKMSPSVDLQFSVNDSNNADGNGIHYKDVRGIAVLKYNLFNGGTDMATIDAATQNLSAILQKRDTLTREVIANVTNAVITLKADKARLQDLRRHVQTSTEVVDGYKKQFILGRSSLLDVLSVQNELFNAKIDLLNGEYAISNDTYNVLAAIGSLTTEFTNAKS